MLNNIYIRKSKGRLITHIFTVDCVLVLKLKINKPQKAVIKFMKAVFKYLKDWYVNGGLDLLYIVLGTVFWPNKQTCHPVRKVPDRNAKPCKGNNNQHMLSCSAKVFKNFNSHNAHNCPTSCHVTVTILQMTNLVSTEVGVSQWL